MHKSAMLRMQWFVENYIPANKHIRVLDVGSYDVNGSYRSLFLERDVDYVGLDMVEGLNVDFVPRDPYKWDELEDKSFDFVISGNAFEHIEYPWLTICEIHKKLKNGGFACIIAPNSIPEHRYPTDCYRYYSDGFKALAKWGGFNIVDVTVSGVPDNDISAEWYVSGHNDVMMVLTKGIDVEKIASLPRFKCEKRYRHAYEWEWRYHFMVNWYNVRDKGKLFREYFEKEHITKLYIYGCTEIGEIVYKEIKDIEGKKIYMIDQQGKEICGTKSIITGAQIDEGAEAYLLCALLDIGMLDKLNLIYPQIRKKYIGDIFKV